ncbi:unnamed protein product [Phyllotreta striolata]|uniref:Cyclin-like domain-containing protein n=1 Tax=Phyllotreta striolata TaxID=444603 RepID=A0A9N9XT48_PHYSR|nr:unnamed protein product [Phyllotreta striolata]
MANSSNPSDRWYFTKEQLENTPSRKCGFDAHKELSNRQQAANFIQDMGQKLKVSQLCINTAIVYMHRFYVFHSFTHFPWHQMAAAALFLAAKVEEQPRKLEYVIRVANGCKNSRDTNIDTNSERYLSQSQDLVFNENVLLQTLGFDVAIDHPHTHVVRCCQLVRASKDLAQTSYFMASNSLHLTTMCIQYKPTVVACFCILVACKWSNWEIPLSNEKKEWYSYVDQTVTSELLQQLTEEFLVIFEKCPSKLKEKIMSIADNVHPIPPSTHINATFDTEPKKIANKDEKDGHSHRSSAIDDPHKHRPSRPHEMGSGQHQRDKAFRDRERLLHQQKSMGSSTGGSSNVPSSSSSSSGNNPLKSHGGHHRPPMDPKMKPPSRPPPPQMPYPPQPKDILREAVSRDSPFGLAKDHPHKDHNKRDYLAKNNQNEGNSGGHGDHRMNYNADKSKYQKQRLDANGRPRVDPSKVPNDPKPQMDNVKKHLNASAHDKNASNYPNKSMPMNNHSNDSVKSVPKQSVVTPVKLSHSNSYAPPAYGDAKPKPEPVAVKEVQTPAVIKRPSLFSPEKSPPRKPSLGDNVLLSPLTSPVETNRERNYSSSSDAELRPVMKKIDQIEGFENITRDSTIGINKTNQSPDYMTDLMTDITSPGSADVSQFSLAQETKPEAISKEIKQECFESNGDINSSTINSNVVINNNSNRSSSVNGLESTDPAVISNLLKEATSVSHLPSIKPQENAVHEQDDKNLNHFHHKSKKKNKDKHKHKDKNREDKEKKKKHKDKDREKHKHKEKTADIPPPAVKLKISKDKIIPVENVQPPSQGLKIKIPKNIINTENISELSLGGAPPPPETAGIKLKIPKDKLNFDGGVSRKRERDRNSPDGPANKMHKSSIKDSKTNGKYSNSNKVSAGITGYAPNPDTSTYQMYSTPALPPPPPPPVPHSQMFYYNRMPPPNSMPNMNMPPPYMFSHNAFYNAGYNMYQGGMFAHPPPMQRPLMHNNSSNPPLPMDAPPQLPPPPPE